MLIGVISFKEFLIAVWLFGSQTFQVVHGEVCATPTACYALASTFDACPTNSQNQLGMYECLCAQPSAFQSLASACYSCAQNNSELQSAAAVLQDWCDFDEINATLPNSMGPFTITILASASPGSYPSPVSISSASVHASTSFANALVGLFWVGLGMYCVMMSR